VAKTDVAPLLRSIQRREERLYTYREREIYGQQISTENIYGRIQTGSSPATRNEWKSGAVIAQELGISDGSLYTWRKQLSEQGEEAFQGKGHQTPTEGEFRQLRAEVERLRQERDILKKAIAIFSQPPGQR